MIIHWSIELFCLLHHHHRRRLEISFLQIDRFSSSEWLIEVNTRQQVRVTNPPNGNPTGMKITNVIIGQMEMNR